MRRNIWDLWSIISSPRDQIQFLHAGQKRSWRKLGPKDNLGIPQRPSGPWTVRATMSGESERTPGGVSDSRESWNIDDRITPWM